MSKLHGQGLQHAGIGLVHVPIRLFIDQVDPGRAGHQRGENDLAFRAGQRCAHAHVNSQSKGNVTVLLPPNVKPVRVVEVGEEVALDAEGDGRCGVASHLVKEIGVGIVLEGVGARPDVEAGVEVLVGQVAGGGGIGESLAQDGGGVGEGVDVILLSL